MKLEKAQATIRQLVTQELGSLKLGESQVKCRYWYGDSMNMLIAVPEVADLDDETIEGHFVDDDEVQPVETGVATGSVEYPSGYLDKPRRDLVQHVVRRTLFEGGCEEAFIRFHIGESGELTIGVQRLDTLGLEDCGDVIATPDDLKEFIRGCEKYYGKFDDKAVRAVIDSYAALYSKDSLDECPQTEFTLRQKVEVVFEEGTLELSSDDTHPTKEYKGLLGVVWEDETVFSLPLEELAFSASPDVIEETCSQLQALAELMRAYPSATFEYDESVPMIHLRVRNTRK